jgi:hypothetical protein
MFGVLAALLLVASFIIPTNLVSPSPVQAAVCKWNSVDMPGANLARGDIVHNSEINKIAVGSDGATIVALLTMQVGAPIGFPMFLSSPFMGLMWSPVPYQNLAAQWASDMGVAATNMLVYDVEIAPDNPAFWVVVVNTTQGDAADAMGPYEVYVTENGGGKWSLTNLSPYVTTLGPTTSEAVGCVDISVDYGGQRDIVVGMREGDASAAFGIYVLKSKGFTSWQLQNVIPTDVVGGNGDIFDIKVSPSYPADGAFAVLFTNEDADGVWYNIALHDIDANDILSWVFPTSVYVGLTPQVLPAPPDEVISAVLQLPSDFSGAAASLRRAYAATYTIDATGDDDGIFRIDNNIVYVLMNTSTDIDMRNIVSLAYFGTYASGKLLAGEYNGDPCSVTVPTWFTDSPTTCPIPCWYNALKPATGAGIDTDCAVPGEVGVGRAWVVWFMNGQVALASTGSSPLLNDTDWWMGILAMPIEDDESAMSISRNNGETWNQLALIDTTIDKFNDFAISADCNTLYLASASVNATSPCKAFDSVWRTSLNGAVVSPLPPIPPLGVWYERVYTRPTGLTCDDTQTDLPLLRLAGYCVEPTGQLVGWAAQESTAQAWSPDYGDYWAIITARDDIQDFVFESSTILYNLYMNGSVQKLPYTGTSWATTQPTVSTGITPGHTIAAMPDGNVVVGFGTGASFPIAVSKDGGATFTPIVQPLANAGDIHVAMDPAYKDNSIVYVGDTGTAQVYRVNVAGAPLTDRWADSSLMDGTNGAVWCPTGATPCAIWGVALAYTGAYGQTALYAADTCFGEDDEPEQVGVWRTLTPLSGLPKPGIAWDYLTANLPVAGDPGDLVQFNAEPYSLKLCGCCTLDTDTTIYALDYTDYVPTEEGMLWAFTDCMAKKGPALITEDKILIGCDPVSGRAQEVNLCWEQLCVALAYDIEISKVADFSILVVDVIGEPGCCGALPMANCFVPDSLTTPCAYFPAGGLSFSGSLLAIAGNLECGHTYYWRVKVRGCVTGQQIRSPWSEVRSFTVKAGLPVTTPYYGPQLLAPNNGCLGCPVKPASFSWSPFKETTKYKFVLATDAAMTQVVTEADVTTTAYEYDGTLNYSTNYFWRVMALEPAPSDWSATFSFLTEAQPAPVTPPGAEPTPFWVWVVIAIGAILVIVTLVLIFKTRRV